MIVTGGCDPTVRPLGVRAVQTWSMLGLLLPMLVYAGITAVFAVNIPFGDDYNVILAFLNRWNGSLSMLFEQHNEHRAVFIRCIVLTVNFLFPSVDLRWLILVGNTGLVLLFIVVCRMADYWKGEPAHMLPVGFLLFSLQNWENMTWALASIQNYWVSFLSLLSICWLVDGDRLRFACGLGLGALSSFTSGNGIIPLIVAGAWQTFAITTGLEPGQSSKRSTSRLLAILGVAAAVSTVYFHGYTSPAQHTHPSTFLSNPFGTAWYFFAFLGSYVVGHPALLSTAAPAGIATCCLFLVLILRGRWRRFPAPYLGLLFVFGSAGLAALTRSDFGIEQAVTSRYRVLSLLGLSLLWQEAFAADLWTLRSRRSLTTVVAIGSLLFFIGSLFFVSSLEKRRNELVRGMALFRNGETHGLVHGSPQQAAVVLRDSVSRGHFRIAP